MWMSKMHEFAHLFDVILSIYFVPFARIIIFGFIFVIIRKLLVGKSTSAKIFLSTSCNIQIYLLVI
jgi:hypothetical protein